MKKHQWPYHGRRFPAAIIGLAVRWYLRCQLSLHDIQEMLFERGIHVSHGSIRGWCDKLGAPFARRIRSARRKVGTTWHLDEVLISMNGEPHRLWRAVDQDGNKIDALVQKRRDEAAAKLGSFGLIRQHFAWKRHTLRAEQYRRLLTARFDSRHAFTHTQCASAMD